MSELPHNWMTAPIGAVTVNCAQRIPSDEEQIQYIDIASIARDKKLISRPQCILGKDAPSRARKHVFAGDVLVSMTRPNLNAVAMVPDSLDGQIASTGFDVLRAPKLDPRWLYYIVRTNSFVERMTELVQGALYPAVKSQDVRSFEAPFAPFNEQKRIADKLDTVLARVDACRERLDRIPAILKRFRQSVLAEATSGKLTENLRNTVAPKQVSTSPESGLFAIPMSWVWAHLGTLAEVKGGKRLPKGQKLVPENTGFPYIKAGQLKNGTVRSEGQEYLPKDVHRIIKRYVVKSGDVFITIVGANIGDAGVIPPEYDKANLTENAAKLCNLKGVRNNYLAFWLQSPVAQSYIDRLTKSGAQGKLALMRIKEIPVPLPSMDEQNEIVRRIESLFGYADRIQAHYAVARAHVERLPHVLLAKAFRGELVPQDPTDEPASVLLERIRSARSLKPIKLKRGMISSPSIRLRKVEAQMLSRTEIQDMHLTKILKERGPLPAEALWAASQLDIDDFYEQLKDEEARGLLREKRGKSPTASRLLEAAA
ncbi:restriction endonuclease subunit S [Candidatus Nitrospira neomarina]|uniref:Restriction endonuclease subunit S n=1 Tax=Candidatus Nitrospira neomarina TaxID=3020899 RepID=A0AA96GSN6_9BACT|nr:restriction endonuclease subunit S [Candidatus Nitrospira neomarina]WNM63364.1 restriction endonuclease subunit S [Candidatus Nitrospira neomarina]